MSDDNKTWLKPDPNALLALALSGSLSDAQTADVMTAAFVPTGINAQYARGQTPYIQHIDELAYAPSKQPDFIVSIATLREAHRTTYLVHLKRGDRPTNLPIGDDTGIMTPFQTENFSHATEEAQAWAEFLGVKVQPFVAPRS